jgi:hypothetical protein
MMLFSRGRSISKDLDRARQKPAAFDAFFVVLQ